MLDSLIQEIEKKVLSQSEIDGTVFFSLNAKIAVIDGKATLIGTKISRPRRSPKERTIQLQKARARRAGKPTTAKPKFHPMFVDFQSTSTKMDFNMMIDMSVEKPEVVIDYKIQKKVKNIKKVKKLKIAEEKIFSKFNLFSSRLKKNKSPLPYYTHWNLMLDMLGHYKQFSSETSSIEQVISLSEFNKLWRSCKAKYHPDRFNQDEIIQRHATHIFQYVVNFDDVYRHINSYLGRKRSPLRGFKVKPYPSWWFP